MTRSQCFPKFRAVGIPRAQRLLESGLPPPPRPLLPIGIPTAFQTGRGAAGGAGPLAPRPHRQHPVRRRSGTGRADSVNAAIQ